MVQKKKKVSPSNKPGGQPQKKQQQAASSVPISPAGGTISRTPTKGSSITVTHREYIRDINQSLNAVLAVNELINPGLDNIFPWLAKIANQYEKYEFVRLSFEYVPFCKVLDTAGGIVMGIDYDVDDQPPDTPQTLTTYAGTLSCSYLRGARLDVPNAYFKRFCNGPLFTRSGAIGTQENRLNDFCRFLVFTSGGAADTIAGKLWVDYVVRLSIPQRTSTVQTLELPPPTNQKTGSVGYANAVAYTVGVLDNTMEQAAQMIHQANSTIASGVSLFKEAKGILDVMPTVVSPPSSQVPLNFRIARGKASRGPTSPGAFNGTTRWSSYGFKFAHTWEGYVILQVMNSLVHKSGIGYASVIHRAGRYTALKHPLDNAYPTQSAIAFGQSVVPGSTTNQLGFVSPVRTPTGANQWSDWIGLIEGPDGVTSSNDFCYKISQVDTSPVVYRVPLDGTTACSYWNSSSMVLDTANTNPYIGQGQSAVCAVAQDSNNPKTFFLSEVWSTALTFYIRVSAGDTFSFGNSCTFMDSTVESQSPFIGMSSSEVITDIDPFDLSNENFLYTTAIGWLNYDLSNVHDTWPAVLLLEALPRGQAMLPSMSEDTVGQSINLSALARGRADRDRAQIVDPRGDAASSSLAPRARK